MVVMYAGAWATSPGHLLDKLGHFFPLGSLLHKHQKVVTEVMLMDRVYCSKKTTVYTKKNRQGLASEGPMTSPV